MARAPSAADAFAAFYKLEDLRRVRDHVFRQIDVLLVPTMPTVYTVEQVLADPIQLNSRLGTYTNFVNLLDLCGPRAAREPASRRHSVRRHGAGARRQRRAAGLARPRISCRHRVCRWARPARAQPPLAPLSAAPRAGEIALAVVGAHLSGMPLNGELKSLGARFLEAPQTAPDYRLFALNGAAAERPGTAARRGRAGRLDRARNLGAAGGRLRPLRRRDSAAALDRNADARRRARGEGLPGRVRRREGARDISSFGGWRAFVAQK